LDYFHNSFVLLAPLRAGEFIIHNLFTTMTKITNIQPDMSVGYESAKVPQSLMNSSRKEFGTNDRPKLRLEVKEGTIPIDLQGHVFIVSPVGFEDSTYGKGLAVFNGDGMIYRLDLDRPEEVYLKTELARTPCFYADNAVQKQQPTRLGKAHATRTRYRFYNWGLMRYSLVLGLRDSLNTAFLPMPFLDKGEERLLVTYDAGRPYEIDTKSLKVVTPAGSNREWRSAIPIKQPFPAHLSTAHPTFDIVTGEMFTVNYGRSVINLLDTIPSFEKLNELPDDIEEFFGNIARLFGREFLQPLFQEMRQVSEEIFGLFEKALETISGIQVPNFVYLLRWDGNGDIERWRLVLSDGSPVKIEQSVHQIGITKDYIVLIDTAFKVGVEQLLNNPIPDNEPLEKSLRILLTRPQFPDSNIYIVRRRDLVNGQRPAACDTEVTVVAKKVVLPLESIHFLTDYDNPDSNITLHIAHNCATDVSEVVRGYDESAYQPGRSLPSRLDGMLAIGQMDVNRLGRYKINGETGAIADSQVIHDDRITFGVGLYTYRERLLSGEFPSKIENIYWHSWGFWEELMPKFIFDLYKDYKHRMLGEEVMRNLPNQKPKPVYLFRVDTESMEFADAYEFPIGYMMSSPQFVPRKDGTGSSTDGYIVCIVLTPESETQDEIWIFDADKLAKGPICKLTHPLFKVGYTLHTTWLPTISSRKASYCIPVREDYQALVDNADSTIRELFERDIYPHFEGK
jgi:carotenoid cleavage dioxygenase-like enzyme